MTSGSAVRRQTAREEKLEEVRSAQQSAERKRKLAIRIGGLVVFLGVIGLVVAALLSARPVVDEEVTAATPFTLPTTDGGTVSLSDYAGKPVILFFNEGAGCDACLLQMAEIEKDADFAAAGIDVVPIVMNTAEQINPDRERFGVTTPFALDDGTISDAYGTLGTGMHEGLPGHSFVLVDGEGVQRWSGNYPSMWLEPSELLDIVQENL